MRWASAISAQLDLDRAVDEAATLLEHQLRGERPELLLAFVTATHAARYGELNRLLTDRLGPCVVVGTSAGGVIGDGIELEDTAGLALSAAVLPGVELTPFHMIGPEAALLDGAERWERRLGVDARDLRAILLLPDPFTCNVQAMLRRLDAALPHATIIGGLASGASGPGESALWAQGELYRDGVVGVALSGVVRVDTLVAQGCRPVGEPLFVTRAHQNVILALDGQRPAEVVRAMVDAMSDADRRLVLQGLYVGLVTQPDQTSYGRGDFLIRNVVGVSPDTGSIAVGALVHPHQVVQFHLHDADSSRQDLREHLTRYATTQGATTAAGALVFSCLGRGVRLYGAPNHDSDAIREVLGDIPLAGFFGNGEIGPVAGSRTTYLHGFTSAIALFRGNGP